MQHLVSVIIPVYNARGTISRTLCSLQEQTLKQWECLCVNDGSKDESPEVIEGLIREDKRIKLIHQPNGGVSSARNRGLSQLNAETLFFLDADDTLNPMCLEALYDYRKETDANWCSCNIAIYTDGVFKCSRLPKIKVVLSRKEFLKYTDVIDTWVVWGKLFDVRWFKLNGLAFNPELRVAEDSLLMTQAVCRATTIAHLGSYDGYNYSCITSSTNLMKTLGAIYPKMRMQVLYILLNENMYEDNVVRFYQRIFMRSVLQDTLKLLKKKSWTSLVYPETFPLISWKIAIASPKLLIGWLSLFICKLMAFVYVRVLFRPRFRCNTSVS